MRNYFTLDGVDSRDFGVYISGQGTFNAPGRDYNLIPVPGRNGDLIGPEKRLQNGTLTYPAFIYTNFKQNIEDFRNFLLSLVGYHDLVDTYHPNEIRKVCFTGPFDADVESKNDAGKFDITFTCKPQRYLASGNEVTTFDSAGETETFSGSIVTFDNPDVATVNALSTAINPIQDLHGYDSPWPAGGGKNKASYVYYQSATGHYSPVISGSYKLVSGKRYVISFDTPNTGVKVYRQSPESLGFSSLSQYDFTLDGNRKSLWGVASGDFTIENKSIIVKSATTETESGLCSNFMIEEVADGVTTPTSYAPYSNICPISGWSEAKVWVQPTHDTTLPPTVTIQLGQTVYGGTLDVTAGKLTVTHAIIASYNGESINEPWISSMDAYVAGTTPTTGAQVVYELATPIVIDLDPVSISTISGQTNNVWANTGDITATIAFPQYQFTITNPTLFDSQPLLRVYGTGILGIGSQQITITQADVYTDIDCEMMDCFKGTSNKNPYVQFTDHNFPVLKPGTNNFSLGTGITKVEITPRWWRV